VGQDGVVTEPRVDHDSEAPDEGEPVLAGFVQGRGAPLVYLPGLSFAHGLPTGPVRAFESALIGPLSASHEVHWIGRRVGVPAGYALAEFAGDYAVEIDRRFGRPMPVVGFSSGGMLGLELALDHPGVVDRLVVVGAGARLSAAARESEGRWITHLAAGRVAEAWRELAADFTADPEGRGVLGAALDAVGPHLTPADCTDGIRLAEAELDVDLLPRLPSLAVPTLLVVGARDPSVGAGLAMRTREAIPGAEVLVLPRSAHLGSMVHPRAIARISAFLRG
jgi:pimeloyl-ACP methyl ester carboxylesterase